MCFARPTFSTSCVDLIQIWNSLQPGARLGSSWEDVHLVSSTDLTYLRIFRRVHTKSLLHADPGKHEDVQDHNSYDSDSEFNDNPNDRDHEEIRRVPASPGDGDTFVVIYDLVYSISYQSPVIYMTFRTSSGLPWVPSLDFLYNNLVPQSQKSAMETAPVHGAAFGALSMSDHPVTNTPAFFVHPCRTNEALQSLTETTESLGAVAKLLKFIGLMGSGVGLAVPMTIAAEVAHKSQHFQAP